MKSAALSTLCLVLFGCSKPDGEPAVTDADEVARTEVERGPVKVTVEVTPARPRLSDEPTLTLTIDAAEGVKISPPPFGEAVGGFAVLDFHTPLPELSDGRRIQRQVYRLEPHGVGPQTILPIPLTFEDLRPDGDGGTHKIETEALTLEVQAFAGDEVPSLADLRPPAGPKELPSPPLSAWWWTLAAVPVVAVLLVWRRGGRKVVAEKVLSPRELAHRELQALLDDDPLGRGDVKTFYVELTGIVRRYIERTTPVRAPELTTPEFLRAVQDEPVFDADRKQRLRSFLESADLVKFAAFEPTAADIEDSFERAKHFVGLTNAPPPGAEAAA